MTKFKIKLINIGRNDYCEEFEKDFADLYAAQEYAYKSVDLHLVSSETSLEATKEKDVYDVCAGFRTVGKVVIKEIAETTRQGGKGK